MDVAPEQAKSHREEQGLTREGRVCHSAGVRRRGTLHHGAEVSTALSPPIWGSKPTCCRPAQGARRGQVDQARVQELKPPGRGVGMDWCPTWGKPPPLGRPSGPCPA